MGVKTKGIRAQANDSITIIESRDFAAHADLLLSDVEKEALFNLLGKDPSRGSSGEHPRILTLEWGRSTPLLIDYAVSKRFDEIYMLAISEKHVSSGKQDQGTLFQIKDKIEVLSDVLANTVGVGKSVQDVTELIQSIYGATKKLFE